MSVRSPRRVLTEAGPAGQHRVSATAARRSDVGMLRSDLDSAVVIRRDEFRASLHGEIGDVRSDLLSMHRQLVFAIVASQFAAVSLASAAASL